METPSCAKYAKEGRERLNTDTRIACEWTKKNGEGFLIK
jgi:hypothetical protein